MQLSFSPVRFGAYTQEDANDVKPFALDENPGFVFVPLYYRRDEDEMIVDTYLKQPDGTFTHFDTDRTMYMHGVIGDQFSPTGEGRDFYWKFNDPELDKAALFQNQLRNLLRRR